MTTHIISGFGSLDVNGNATSFLADQTLTIVARSGEGMEYTVLGTNDDDVPEIDIDSDAYNVLLNGQDTSDLDIEAYLLRVTWPGGETIVLNLEVPGPQGTEQNLIFPLSGAPFPAVNSLSDFQALEDQVTGFSLPDGTFGPNTFIPFAAFDLAAVTEDDIIRGTDGSDEFRGGAGRDALFGEGGDDMLFGGATRDTLNGGSGDDTLNGGKGRDTLIGNSGRDILDGGKSADVLTGGVGGDTFVFAGQFGDDVVTDFNAISNKEKIDLTGAAGIGGFRDLSTNHMTQVGDDVVIEDSKGNTITLLDVDLADLDKGDFLL